MFRYYQSNSLHRSATKTLLLTIPFLGFVSQLAPAHAQPALTPPTVKGTAPFSPELKTILANLVAFSAQDRVCRRLVDLRAENASLRQVIAQLKQTLPTGTLHVEVRGDTPIKASLDLTQVRLGDALSNLARLAGCKLYVLPDTLLIVPEPQLSPGELREIKSYSGRNAGAEWLQEGSSWTSGNKATLLFTRAVAQEATGQDTTTDEMRGLTPGITKTTFGAFSPESQAMLREIAAHINENNQGYVSPLGFPVVPIYLNADSPVTFTIYNPGQLNIDFPLSPLDPSTPNKNVVSRGLGIVWSPT